MSIARVALPVAVPQLFDYWVPEGLAVGAGSIVKVKLGRRACAGVVLELAGAARVPPERLQPIEAVVPLPALPDDVLALAAFVAGYYQETQGLACALALPPLAAGERARSTPPALALTAEGRVALSAGRGRSPAAATLFARLEGPDARLTAADVAALAPAARRVLARWRASGFVAAPAPAPPAAAAAFSLNDAQAAAVAAIASARGEFVPFLLQGVTGSGKTEVYLDAAAACIAAGGQVLVLVPEINLTPQFVARVTAALPRARTATLHSGLAAGERRAHWLAAATGRADLVLGTRLAVFAPLPRLALVVVDEEHDASFKQQEGTRYHARDLAVWRARARRVPVVLGSATPSLESYAHARAGRYRHLRLPQRADPRAAPPAVRFVPARGEGVREGLAAPLLEAIGARLASGEQALVFVNRRGYAPALRCSACGWEAGCPRCSARLVAHREPVALACHHCGHRERMPRACPECGNVDLLPLGHGTQRLERVLAETFPHARIARVDRDTTRRKGAFAAIRAQVEARELDILVGTQMLAKGHDFPRLTLVGVLGADNALYSADFRATERLAALLIQVAGRAGRADRPGEVIVQTDFPGHPLFAALRTHDYATFAAALLAEREAAELPPSAHLALVLGEAHHRADVDALLALAHDTAREAARALGGAVEVFAPVPAPMARRAGMERGQLLLRAARRGDLARVLPPVAEALRAFPSRRARWSIDVDPLALA